MNAPATLAETGEFSIIDLIIRRAPDHPALVVGPGDDAAVMAVAGRVVCSTDAMIDGVHFRRTWSSATDVGHKVVARTVADIEAMGARPLGLTLALSAPGEVETAWVSELAEGVVEECATAGIALLGGDVAAGPVISLVGTALGELDDLGPVLRSGARAGEVVAMVGRLGWAEAGLRTLSRGFRSPRVAVEAHRRPEIPYGRGMAAARAGATAMIDISDGLLADLGHLCRASGVGVDLDSAAFAIGDAVTAVARATGGDPLDMVLRGGDDHALVATFARAPDGWTVIGRVVGSDEPVITVDGQRPEGAGGHDHFGGDRQVRHQGSGGGR